MTATSSPEGSADMNLFLSKGRALALKKYLALRSDDREGVDTLSARVGSARTGTGCMNWYWQMTAWKTRHIFCVS